MIDIFQGTGAPITQGGFDAAASRLGVNDLASLWSLLSVETRGFGYLPDRRPKILFERHIFHARTGGRFSAANPDISNSARGGYLGGAAEYQRLKRAMVLDRKSALESASWGLGQVMGFNASKLEYETADAMVDAFKQSEDKQLDGCAAFISATGALLNAFRQRNWARVAFFYNGQNYAANGYDQKLRDAHARYQQELPDIEVRAAQARLAYLGFDPRGIDGVIGPGTRIAVRAFQSSRNGEGVQANGELDEPTKAALQAAVGV
jgi:hypothetical protein